MSISFFIFSNILQIFIIGMIGYTAATVYKALKESFNILRKTKYAPVLWTMTVVVLAFIVWALAHQFRRIISLW